MDCRYSVNEVGVVPAMIAGYHYDWLRSENVPGRRTIVLAASFDNSMFIIFAF